MNVFPADNQQRLLAEAGLVAYFTALWVDIGDLGEVARRLHIAEDTRVVCGFKTALKSHDPGSLSRTVWISSLTPDWSLILHLTGGHMPDATELSVGGHRVFDITHLEEEIIPIGYSIDGNNLGEIFSHEEYSQYWADLEDDPGLSLDEELEQQLCVMGRITGRFLDREWLASPGVLGELSPSH
ncbi:hypothetical protein [Bailinhaonella thermotolerans]|uniref:Uncharacterized protein n=1 Tax=Bailinhaonella thermotolerans TaxID=1070861 RepID=A0A3A4A607_9ACTN|nr:hypothetical protein [Bailinhaonella thermotolerans]RJL23289.1 hypothetical protein D5H75_33555 [Bailinhaonella thermotolerans]